MRANNSRIYPRSWGTGHLDPLGYEREFRVMRGPAHARMENALLDLSNIFFRIMLWAVIYQICHIVTTVTLQWIAKYFKQKKRARKNRQAPQAERPSPNTPELRHIGPTMT